MILQCEACGARFEAPDEVFAAGERLVRCGRCQHSWMQGPQGQISAAPPKEPAAAVSPLEETDENVSVADETTEAAAKEADAEEAKPEPKESTPDVPYISSHARMAAIRAAARYRAGVPRWMTALSTLCFFASCALALLNFMPQAVGLKSTTALGFQGIELSRVTQENGTYYHVVGTIVNKRNEVIPAPDLVFQLLDEQGRVAKEWRRKLPANSLLDAGGRLSFTIEDLDAPSPDVADPHIRVEMGNSLEIALRRMP